MKVWSCPRWLGALRVDGQARRFGLPAARPWGQDTDSPEARSSPERQNCVVAHSPTRTRAPPTGPKISAAVSDPGTCSLVRNAKPATHIDTTPNAQSQTSSRHRKEKERQKRVPSEVLLDRKSTRLNSSHVKISYA